MTRGMIFKTLNLNIENLLLTDRQKNEILHNKIMVIFFF